MELQREAEKCATAAVDTILLRVTVIGLDELPPVPPPRLAPEAEAKLAQQKELLVTSGVKLMLKPGGDSDAAPSSAKGKKKPPPKKKPKVNLSVTAALLHYLLSLSSKYKILILCPTTATHYHLTKSTFHSSCTPKAKGKGKGSDEEPDLRYVSTMDRFDVSLLLS